MEEFLSFASALGFDAQNWTLDGKIHRFARNGRKKADAWYIGFTNFTSKKGEPYTVVEFGDWATDEHHFFKPKKRLSKEDSAAVAERMKAAREQAAQEKRQRQKAAAAKALVIWDGAQQASKHGYLSRKGLDGPHGTKEAGDELLVPMVGQDGQLVGIQRIGPEGRKLFISGQQTAGTYHLIGTVDDELYICEGFATAATVHMATGKPAAAAFYANNLESVARFFRSEHPRARIWIAGDDDKWTKINEKPANPGREKAEAAAKAATARAIFPRFSDENGHPTDWNDLYLREGLETVAGQLRDGLPLDTGYIPLGFDESVHFFYVISSKSIVKTQTFADTFFLQTMPLEYWASRYPTEKGAINWLEAKNDLITQSVGMGPFDPLRVRGTGVWLDRGKPVVNTGDSLLVGGRKIGFGGIKSAYTYVQTRNRMADISPRPLSVTETEPMVEACRLFNWRDPKHAHFLAGWLSLARCAGALPVRPHVWITGKSGSGKSTLLDRLCRPCLGNKGGKVMAQGGTTEAGLRQTIKADSLPVIFDEFETSNGDFRNERQRSILELLRQCWSHSDGYILKGTTSGYAVQYAPSFAALVSSIRVSLDNDADRSRFTVMEIDYHDDDSEKWKRLSSLLRTITQEYGERLFARSISQLTNIIETYRILREEMASLVSHRFGQQYGMLLAGYWHLFSDSPMVHETAQEFLKGYTFEDERIEAGETDELECLNHLLTARVMIDDGADKVAYSIGEIAEGTCQFKSKSLRHYGILVDNDGLYVANNNTELRKLFKGTQWVNWGKSLSRLHGAKRNQQKWIGLNAKCTFVPRQLFKK